LRSARRRVHHKCYPRPMPIRVAIMCEKCERIYPLAHPAGAKRIKLTLRSASHPRYRLTCQCKEERYFDRAQTLPYRVSEYACSRGDAERNDDDAIPSQKDTKDSWLIFYVEMKKPPLCLGLVRQGSGALVFRLVPTLLLCWFCATRSSDRRHPFILSFLVSNQFPGGSCTR